MVRAPGLKLALVAFLVVLAHLVGLEWLARQADKIAGMSLMAPPMYTRLLKPATPPPVVVTATARAPVPKPPRTRAAPVPKPPASSAKDKKEKDKAQEPEVAEQPVVPPEPVPAPAPEPPVAQAPAPAASEPVQAASAAAEPASAPVAAASAPEAASDPLANWPGDTRLTYRVSGDYRGPLYGSARVLWQREGEKYQVRLEANVAIITQTLTSQGEVTPDGLVPRSYEELRTGGKRRWAQLGEQVVLLEKGTTVPRPPGVQDTASQFVELTQRFATGKDPLEVGRTVTVWLARPAGVDQWVYDVVGREMLRTPRLGEVEAFHLKPRPPVNPRGNITAEMWFAPSLQYLPVRIKVMMGSDAYLDLIVDQIEQR